MVAYIKSDLEFILEQIKICGAACRGYAAVRSWWACPGLQPLPGSAHGRRHLQQPVARAGAVGRGRHPVP